MPQCPKCDNIIYHFEVITTKRCKSKAIYNATLDDLEINEYDATYTEIVISTKYNCPECHKTLFRKVDKAIEFIKQPIP